MNRIHSSSRALAIVAAALLAACGGGSGTGGAEAARASAQARLPVSSAVASPSFSHAGTPRLRTNRLDNARPQRMLAAPLPKTCRRPRRATPTARWPSRRAAPTAPSVQPTSGPSRRPSIGRPATARVRMIDRVSGVKAATRVIRTSMSDGGGAPSPGSSAAARSSSAKSGWPPDRRQIESAFAVRTQAEWSERFEGTEAMTMSRDPSRQAAMEHRLRSDVLRYLDHAAGDESRTSSPA